MKRLIKIKYCILIVAVCAGFLFKACKREKPVYGDAYIYMPQATTSGGLNNTYIVPSGGGALTYNIKSDSTIFMIVMSWPSATDNNMVACDPLYKKDRIHFA